MPRAKSTPFVFEDALAQLETLVNQMESGALSLDESMKAFEAGVKLTRECQKALSDAEQKVQILLSDQTTQLFKPADEDF